MRRWHSSTSSRTRCSCSGVNSASSSRYADEVLAVDTAGVAPTAYVVTRQESERPDQVRPSLDREVVLRHAPDASLDSGFFRYRGSSDDRVRP